jgi:hypothetical protein
VVGPLKPPGAHDAEAERGMWRDAEQVFGMLNALRDADRARMVRAMHEGGAGAGFIYQKEMMPGPGLGGQLPLVQSHQQQFPHAQAMMVDQKGLVVPGQGGGQGPSSGGQHP